MPCKFIKFIANKNCFIYLLLFLIQNTKYRPCPFCKTICKTKLKIHIFGVHANLDAVKNIKLK